MICRLLLGKLDPDEWEQLVDEKLFMRVEQPS